MKSNSLHVRLVFVVVAACDNTNNTPCRISTVTLTSTWDDTYIIITHTHTHTHIINHHTTTTVTHIHTYIHPHCKPTSKNFFLITLAVLPCDSLIFNPKYNKKSLCNVIHTRKALQ